MSRAVPIIIIPTDRLDLDPAKPKVLPKAQREQSPPRAARTVEEARPPQRRQKARVLVSDDSADSDDHVDSVDSGTDDSSESQEQVPKRRTEDVRADAHVGARDDNHGIVADSVSIEVFWATIAKMNWKNKGERQMTSVPALNGNTRTIFRAVYKTLYQSTLEMLEADGMFGRNDISPQNKHIIVSHIIGLGKETHSTLMLDMEFLQILVVTDECQSLDALLPGDIRQG